MPQFDRKDIFVFGVPNRPDLKFGLSYPKDNDWAQRARQHPVISALKGDEVSTVSPDTSAYDVPLISRLLEDDGINREAPATSGRKYPGKPGVYAPLPPEPGAEDGSTRYMVTSPDSPQYPKIDPIWARRTIELLDTCHIVEEACSISGREVIVTMQVGPGKAPDGTPGNVTTVHRMKLPNARQIDAYFQASRTSATKIKGPKQVKQVMHLAPGGELYDACVDHVEGYAGGAAGVPLNHKAAVAAELADLADKQLQPEFEDPNA